MTNEYRVLADTPRLGKAGALVHLNLRQAKYWLLAGAIELVAHGREPKPATRPAKPSGRKVGADRGRDTDASPSDTDTKPSAKKTDGEKA